jgi:hypothetical protein
VLLPHFCVLWSLYLAVQANIAVSVAVHSQEPRAPLAEPPPSAPTVLTEDEQRVVNLFAANVQSVVNVSAINNSMAMGPWSMFRLPRGVGSGCASMLRRCVATASSSRLAAAMLAPCCVVASLQQAAPDLAQATLALA